MTNEILELLNYYNSNPSEEVFCELVEKCAKVYANMVSKDLVDEEDIDAFIAQLPIEVTDKVKTSVARAKADINVASMERDNSRDAMKTSKVYVYKNGPSMVDDDNELSKVA